MNSIIGVIEDGVNGAIDLINKAISAYNKLPLAPDIGLISNVAIGRISVPTYVPENRGNDSGRNRGSSKGTASGSIGDKQGQRGTTVNIDTVITGTSAQDVGEAIGWELTKKGVG